MTDRTSSGSSSRRTKPGGDSIGQFVIDQEIGKGSFAQVYSGKHKVSSGILHPTLPPKPW
jgi:serine/threonine-protein kinase ULK/ATG1